MNRPHGMRWLTVFVLCIVIWTINGCEGGDDSTPPAPPGNTNIGTTSPTADAGSDQNVTTGQVVTLDGSASQSPTGALLTYQWTFTTRPAGSTATLSVPTSVKPTFTADLAGVYVVTLTVNNGTTSLPDTVTVTAVAGNAAPVANAGPDQTIVTGRVVTLDGTGSSDANGDPLTYAWSFTSKPGGSTATLAAPTSVHPTFTADVAGTYVASLTVRDGQSTSLADTVTVTAIVGNVAPVANAGPDQTVITGRLVTLDGSGSSDANGDPLVYSWSFTSKPANSTATLTNANTVHPTFTPDFVGSYVLTLTVSDNQATSTIDSVVVNAQLSSFVDATLQAYVKASNTEGQDYFGNYIALSGDTLAVGAYQEDSCATGINGVQTNGCLNSGAVYVFTRTAGVWSQQAYLKGSNTEAGDRFGHSLALSGDTLAVAAYDEASCGISGNQANNGCSGTGAVYVFTRTAGTWTQQAYLKDMTYTISGEHFGQSVSLQGDTLAVGAMFEGNCRVGTGTCTGSGAVFIFTRSGGVWTKQGGTLKPSDDVNDYFGSSVALDRNTLAVGAIGEDSCATGVNGNFSNNDCGYAGAVYVYTQTAGVWNQQAYLKASNTNADDKFGHTIALNGDTLAVAASGEDSCATGVNGDQSNNVCGQAGAVYIFTRTAGVWTQQTYVKASNTGFNPNFPDSGDEFGGVQTGNIFGVSVALSGDRLAVGAWEEDSCATGINGNQTDNGCSGAGAVYVFTRTGNTWSQEAYVKASNANTADAFGFAAALSGDTLAVSAFGEGSCATGINGNQTPLPGCDGSGAVYVYVKP